MKSSLYKAFTLIELLVSIGIVSLLTGVLVYKYPDSSIRLNLVNISHSLALLVREAQVRGSAVDSSNGAFAGYGVFLDLSNPTKLLLYGDTVTQAIRNGIYVGDGLYNTTPVDEKQTVTTLPRDYIVKKLCVGISYPFTCNDYANPHIETLNIAFMRPDPEPLIYVNGTTATSYTGACIEVWSPKAPLFGHIRSVQVLGAGLITTSNSPCDAN